MELLNHWILLVVLNFCSVIVARKGSQSNQKLLHRLESIENFQRSSNNKLTRLDQEFKAQTDVIEQQKKAINYLEATVRQLSATIDRTNRLARRNRRKYASLKSFIINKGLEEWSQINKNNKPKSHRLNNHRNSNQIYHKSNTYHHNQHKTLSLNSSVEKYNQRINSENSNHHNQHVNHKSNKTNTHHHSYHQDHESNHHSNYGQSRKQNQRIDSNTHSEKSHQKVQNMNGHNHQGNDHISTGTHRIKTSTETHTITEKTTFPNGLLRLGSDSTNRKSNHSHNNDKGYTTEIRSIHLSDTHGFPPDHKQESNDINEKKTGLSNRKHPNENQETRHLQSNETPDRRRNLMRPRQAFGGIAFSVYLDHDATIGQHETIKFNKIITNDGGGYSALTGVFTCTEGGVYMFTFFIGQRDQDHYMWAELMVNSINLIDAVVDTYHPYQDLQGGNTVIMRLKQGDRVWIDATHNGSHLEGSGTLRLSTFSGLYLYG